MIKTMNEFEIRQTSTKDLEIIKKFLKYSCEYLGESADDAETLDAIHTEIELIDDEIYWRESQFPKV